MLVGLAADCTEAQRRRVVEAMTQAGAAPVEVRGAHHVLVASAPADGLLQDVPIEVFPGVARVVRVTKPYALGSLEHRKERSAVRVGDVVIGGGPFTVIAGPCAVEDYTTLLETARAVKSAGADLLRGGAYKPRTSPY